MMQNSLIVIVLLIALGAFEAPGTAAASENDVAAILVDGSRFEYGNDLGHFATWCTSDVEESNPALAEQCRSFDERIRALPAFDLNGVRLVGFATVYSTNEASLPKFRDRKGIGYPLVFDQDGFYGSKFGMRSFPHLTVPAADDHLLFSGDAVPADIRQSLEAIVGSDSPVEHDD